jgi:hypothetical protein
VYLQLRPTMARRLLPALLVSACYTQVNSFTPPGFVVVKELDSELSRYALPTVEDSSCSTDDNLRDLPPVLQSIADERREFQLNLGKAMDTLRKDMPEILKRPPGRSTFRGVFLFVDSIRSYSCFAFSTFQTTVFTTTKSV